MTTETFYVIEFTTQTGISAPGQFMGDGFMGVNDVVKAVRFKTLDDARQEAKQWFTPKTAIRKVDMVLSLTVGEPL